MKVQKQIEDKLTGHFQPEHLDVINESGNHNVPPGSESHFRVVLVTPQFEGKNRVARHRMVNKVLAEELNGLIHALALSLHTPEQWRAAGGVDPTASPECAHK